MYELVLKEPAQRVKGLARKDVGDRVFLGALTEAYSCYALYYSGNIVNAAVQDALRSLGSRGGKNVFVNIGSLGDDDYPTVAKLFEISRIPVVVITATAPLAAPDTADFNAFVRLDSKPLLESPERTVQCVQEIATLFLRGDVAAAIAAGKWSQRAELARVVSDAVWNALRSAFEFIAERDISVSLLEGKLELKRADK